MESKFTKETQKTKATTADEKDSQSASEKAFDFDRIGKIGVSLAGLLYMTGLLTVNAYLYQLGVSEFDLLKAKYVYTGALVLIPIVLCTLAPILGYQLFQHERSEKSAPEPELGFLMNTKLARMSWPNLILWPAIPYFLFLGVLVALDEMRMEYFWQILGFYFICFTNGFYAYVTGAVLLTRPISGDSKQPPKPVPGRIVAFGLVLFFVAYFAWYLSIFTRHIYPKIPEQFGGGRPRWAQLMVRANALDEAQRLGLTTSKDNPLTPSVRILFEGKEVYVLQLPDGRVVQVNRDMFRALEITRQ